MKILLVSYKNPHFVSFCEYIHRAIEELGHEVEFFDYRDWSIPGRIREIISPLHNWDIKRINNSLLKQANQFKPDVVLVTGGWTITADTIDALKEKGIVAINWIADFPNKFDLFLNVGPHYDFFFASGTDALKRYNDAGHNNGHWLPFACDPDEHRPVELTEEEKEKYKCDICFTGSCYTERIEILEQLTDFDLQEVLRHSLLFAPQGSRVYRGPARRV